MRNCFTRERNKPLASTRPGERNSFWYAFYQTVQPNMNRANFRQNQSLTIKLHAIPVLRESHAIVPPKLLKARITDLSLFRFDTAEEGLKSQINSFSDVLQNHRMYEFECGAFGFPIGKHALGIVPTNRRTSGMRIPPLCKRLIVYPSALLAARQECAAGLLSDRCGICRLCVSYVFLLLDVLLDDIKRDSPNGRNELAARPERRQALLEPGKLVA